jgi:predicted nucleotidyltransferase
MRSVPTTFDPVVVEEIDRRLDEVERARQVAVAWCVESGSRAWGFPSPDSDYDVRFVFVRSEDEYLSPWMPRDVIETPLDEVYDVNGWDLRKALQLVVKGNAVVVEWLRSPFVYRGVESFRDELIDLAEAVTDRVAVGRHYTHVCQGQWDRYGASEEVSLKRLFYAIRPAATVRWLEEHPESAVPPMEIGKLLQQNGASSTVRSVVDELVQLKSRTREMGTGAVPAPLARYIGEAIAYGRDHFGPERESSTIDRQGVAADGFRHLVRTYGAGQRP